MVIGRCCALSLLPLPWQTSMELILNRFYQLGTLTIVVSFTNKNIFLNCDFDFISTVALRFRKATLVTTTTFFYICFSITINVILSFHYGLIYIYITVAKVFFFQSEAVDVKAVNLGLVTSQTPYFIFCKP